MPTAEDRGDASTAEEGGSVRERRQAEMQRAQATASSPGSEPITSSTTQLLAKDNPQNPQMLALDTIQDTELQEQGILGSLFRSLTETLGLIVNEVKSQPSAASYYVSLESTCAALFFWGNDLGLSRDSLDNMLQYSPQLRGTCMAVLVSISHFVISSLLHLIISVIRQSEILRSTSILSLVKHGMQILDEQHDFTYLPETQGPEMMCQTLRTKVDTLITLAPSLASPTEETYNEEQLRAIEKVEKSFPGQAYAGSIAEKFPLAPPDIVARLGTLNWDRYNHILRLQRESMKQELQVGTLDKAKTIFHDSGLGTSVPAKSEVEADAGPVYEPSIVSSRAEASHKRVPPLSAQARSGEPFTCEICEKRVRFQHTEAWKKHVFEDVLAYACFFAKCHDTRVFFEDGEGLMTHLQDQHDMDVRVSDITCPLCVEFTSGDRDILSLHIAHHMEEIAVAILPAGVNSGKDSDDDSVSDATSSKMDKMPLKQRAMSPEESKDTTISKKRQPGDENIVAVDSDGHCKDQLPGLHRDQKGPRWIAFEFTRKGVKTVVDIRSDFETVDVKRLSHGLKLQNCIYPRALITRKEHEDDDLDTQRTRNSIGWALAEAYPILQGDRGLLLQAVETVCSVRDLGEGEPAYDAAEMKVPGVSTENSRRRQPCRACARYQTGCLVVEGATRCVLCEHYQEECVFPSADAEPRFVPQSQVISSSASLSQVAANDFMEEESSMTLKLRQLKDAQKSKDLGDKPRLYGRLNDH